MTGIRISIISNIETDIVPSKGITPEKVISYSTITISYCHTNKVIISDQVIFKYIV